MGVLLSILCFTMALKQKKVPDLWQPSRRDVIDLINIISAMLTIHEQRVQCLMAEEKAEREKKLPSPALMHATLGFSSDHASKPISASSGQDTHIPQPTPRTALRPPHQDPQLPWNGPALLPPRSKSQVPMFVLHLTEATSKGPLAWLPASLATQRNCCHLH